MFKKRQFSWTADPKIAKTLPHGRAWDKALAVATMVALGFFEPPAELVGARYYMNPSASNHSNKCWMATTFGRWEWWGDHYFYSEEPAWLVPPRFGCGKFVGKEPAQLTS